MNHTFRNVSLDIMTAGVSVVNQFKQKLLFFLFFLHFQGKLIRFNWVCFSAEFLKTHVYTPMQTSIEDYY